jgi:hypothetical protein
MEIDGENSPLPPLPPPLEGPSILDKPIEEIEVPSSQEIDALDCDGYAKPSKDFMGLFEAPLPKSSASEIKTPPAKRRRIDYVSQRPATPADIGEIIDNLVQENPVDHKKFLKKITAKKRPAAAMKRPAAVAEDAPDEEATAVAEGALDLEHEFLAAEKTTAVAEGALALENVDESKEIEFQSENLPWKTSIGETIRSCIEFLLLEDRAAQSGKITHSFQRKTHVYQVQDLLNGRRIAVQVTDKQFGSQDLAQKAVQVLHHLFEIGATKHELQTCKNNGLLFGVRTGTPM